jgi:ring-1,2-phenylacetyl-CoA epoxidase subunit PaaE
VLAGNLPRSWSAALAQLRRDVTTVGRRVTGHHPPPLVKGFERSAAPPALPTPNARGRAEARELVVARVIRETVSAVTLVLRAPDNETFAFLPGQFFTLLTEIEGEIVPRNYSASNVPGEAELHLTIKTKTGGRVSPVLSRTRPGDSVRVLGPFGSFVLPVLSSLPARRRLVLVAGGAGITPLASIARTVLATEPHSEVALLYANRREEDVILAAQLEALVAYHGARFTLRHVLEEPPPGWAGAVGRLDRRTAARALDTLPLTGDSTYFVCGPDPMRDEVLAALAARGVSEDAIRIERFCIGPRPQVATSSAAIAASVAPGARPIAIRVKDRTHRTTALPGATLLEAGLAAGADMPFSCGVGGCGACRVKVIEGSVEVEEPNCLSAAERAAGYVLACVGRPCGPCTVEIS